jgi:hypothetical protein
MYHILLKELKNERVSKESIQQIAVKVIYNTAGPDSLVLTLLIFRAYPRITKFNPPIASTTQHTLAMKKTMEELTHIQAII